MLLIEYPFTMTKVTFLITMPTPTHLQSLQLSDPYGYHFIYIHCFTIFSQCLLKKIYFLSILKLYMDGLKLYVFFWVQLLSRNIMILGFIHDIACI